MNRKIIKKRISSVRRRMKKKKINCLILTKPANVTYITGFSGDDTWSVITPAAVYLLTDSRYTEQAQSQCPYCRIIQRTAPMAKAAAELIKKLKSVKIVTVENFTSLVAFEALKKNVKARLKSAADIIEPLRSIKDISEIVAVKAAARIAGQSLSGTVRYIKQGITENQLAGTLDFQIRRLGGKNSFETIVAFGPNASRPHHQPSSRKLKKNDCALIDFGVRYKNYCCDLTRCFIVGMPTPLYRKVYDAVREAQAAAIKMVKPGVEMRKVDAAAREVLAKYDLPLYGHGTGHGLGLEVHEQPFLSAQSKGKLRAGMVFTIEPAVYIPGKLGVRIEDDILVTEASCEVLSYDNHERV
jgi:Xaa-Pro aminopeptidase